MSCLAMLKGVHELNKTTALYVSVSRDLGSCLDSVLLRHQLACIRKRVLTLAQQNKLNILPHLRTSVLHLLANIRVSLCKVSERGIVTAMLTAKAKTIDGKSLGTTKDQC